MRAVPDAKGEKIAEIRSGIEQFDGPAVRLRQCGVAAVADQYGIAAATAVTALPAQGIPAWRSHAAVGQAAAVQR